MKSVFNTQFEKRPRVRANVGSRIKTKYQGRYDDKGRVVLEEAGTENIYDFIQSFKDSTDIHVLLKRYANGDSEALAKVQGFYADVTEMPTTLANALNIVNDGENFFNTLPVDVRAKFGHNFGEFMMALSDGSVFSVLGMDKPIEPEPASADPVKEVTSE